MKLARRQGAGNTAKSIAIVQWLRLDRSSKVIILEAVPRLNPIFSGLKTSGVGWGSGIAARPANGLSVQSTIFVRVFKHFDG